MEQTTENERTNALHALYGVLETGNAMSRCHAIRAIERLQPYDAESRRRLIDLLSDPDPDVRTDTVAALGNLEIGEATRALLDIVEQDHEGDVRVQAVIALSKIRSRDAVDRLIACFKADGYPELDYLADDMEFSPCWEVQSQALDALGKIRDGRATQALIEVLESAEYDDLQERGFEVLARLDEDTSRVFLIRQLSDQSPRTRRRAAKALGSLLHRDGNDRDHPREIIDALANTLADADPGVRTNAAQALAGVDDPAVWNALSELIGDPDPEVRASVAVILGKTKGREILERLHELLEEPDLKIRRSVVRILGQIGDSRSRDALIRLLESHDESLLQDVLRSLGQIGASGMERQLAAILSSQQMHSAVRMQAALALGNILRHKLPPADREDGQEAERDDDPVLIARHMLAAMVFDEDEQVACASLSALVNAFPDESVAWLSDVLLARPLMIHGGEQTNPRSETASTTQQQDAEDEDAEDEDADADLLVGDDPQTSTLTSIVLGHPGESPVQAIDDSSPPDTPAAGRSENPVIREFAARLLGGVAKPGTPGVDALIEAFHGGDSTARRECVLALGRIGDPAALPVVFEALASKQSDVRLAAVDTLKEFRMPAGAQEYLDALCTDADPNVRCAAISALGRGSAAKDCLYRALVDENQQVCRTALNKLSKATYSESCRKRVLDLMSRFSGELRSEVGAVLRRVGDLQGAARLRKLLRDDDQEELHWLCIDALSEFYAGTVSGSEG